MKAAALHVKRVYEPATDADGVRLLVDRLWPRGISKQHLQAAAWLKNIAPSTELRHWFAHRPKRAEEFRKRYVQELDANPQAVAELRQWLAHGHATLLYAAHDTLHNNAVVLRDYLLQDPAGQ